jgi:Porin PorA
VDLPEEAPTLTQAAPDTVTRRRRVLPRSGGRIRPVLAGLGAFLMTFGLLLRFYAAPRLIAAPVGIYSTVTLADPHASYFDQGTLAARHDVALTFHETIRGDAAASTGRIAVWDVFTALEDLKHDAQLNVAFQRSAFNRRTGELTNCCGASVNGEIRARQDGIGAVKWPIGTQKTTYQVYDLNTERAWPAVYSGAAHVQGLLTYRFTQRIPPTVVQQLPGVPTSLLGLTGTSRNVLANRTFQASNTFWVDPLTGAPVDAEERILSVLHGPGGQGRLMVATADLKMTPASQRSLAALARQNAVTITTLRQTGPLGGLLLGILLILAATMPFPRLPRQARSERLSGWPAACGAAPCAVRQIVRTAMMRAFRLFRYAPPDETLGL